MEQYVWVGLSAFISSLVFAPFSQNCKSCADGVGNFFWLCVFSFAFPSKGSRGPSEAMKERETYHGKALNQEATNYQLCHGEWQLTAACVIPVLHSAALRDKVDSLLFNTATAPGHIYYYLLSCKQRLLHNAWNRACGCSSRQEISTFVYLHRDS